MPLPIFTFEQLVSAVINVSRKKTIGNEVDMHISMSDYRKVQCKQRIVAFKRRQKYPFLQSRRLFDPGLPHWLDWLGWLAGSH